MHRTISIILVLMLIPLSAFPFENHMKKAIWRANVALRSLDAETISKNSEKAKAHALKAKDLNDYAQSGALHLEEGIECLDKAIIQANLGAEEQARAAALKAASHFRQAIK